MDGSLPLWVYYVVGFPLLLGPLVTLHELGHYLVGRWFGVGAEAFSVGFGKELIGWTDKRGTRWKLSAIPLGGYVQFKGDMNPASMPDPEALEQDDDEPGNGSFHRASLGKRALIVFAGPFANLLITLAIFAAFFMFLGKPTAIDADQQLTIGEFSEESAAREAGLQVGDKIVAVGERELTEFADLREEVLIYPGRELQFTIERDGAQQTVPITVRSVEQEDEFGNVSRIGLIGVMPAAVEYDFVRQGPLTSAGLAVERTIGMMDMMLTGLGQIITGERSVKELGGPIKIAKYSGEWLSLGLLAFIEFAALISLNLAFINLLPIPALDGGHLVFYAAEAVRRKPVSARGQEVAFRAGMALVLGLMVFVTINDLISLPVFGN
ncbi:RIP metalloprotease RseP [Qipengyuania sp. DGS5-3]|uniref:RIP metalloprotease RseP n=1 Tax=Qipengyuania sp. DGS5-3 TaxID=3349632 RepID=UPI0036D2CECD